MEPATGFSAPAVLPASLGGFLPSLSHPIPSQLRRGEARGHPASVGAGCLFPVPRYFGCPPTSEEAAERFFPLKVSRGCIWSLYTTVTNRFLARSELARRKGSGARCPGAADDTAPGTGASTARWDHGKQTSGRILPGRSCPGQLPGCFQPLGAGGGRVWGASAVQTGLGLGLC